MKKIISIIFIGCILFCQNVKAQCLEKTQDEWKGYFKEHISELDPIEGVWSSDWHGVISFTDGEKDMVMDDHNDCIIIKNGEYYYKCRVSKETGVTIPCALKGINGHHSVSIDKYQKTAITGVYVYISYSKLDDKDELTDNANAVLNDNILKYKTSKEDQSGSMHNYYQLLKIFPTNEDTKVLQPSSGTGFALTSNGYIVTNYHVVNGAKIITVKGINGNFQRAYDAKVVTVDKNNDLAIIQIDDPSFKSLGQIPYVASSLEFTCNFE